jgi:hypothetical protein
VFDEDSDEQELSRIMEYCNEARNFFDSAGLRAIQVVTCGGHPLHIEHFRKAKDALSSALGVLESREPHAAFPAELKSKYREHLLKCYWKIEGWWHEVKQ